MSEDGRPEAGRPPAAPAPSRLGLIGGSGLYRMAGIDAPVWTKVETPWGSPSDDILLGDLEGRAIAFLPRHGRGHRLAPNEINYRANIAALKAVGCDEILAVSAVGSFREGLAPGTFVMVDQFVDRTLRMPRSFFGDGVVGHVGFAQPTCSRLSGPVAASLAALNLPHSRSGTMLVIEGPQFSSAAESRLHRAQGLDVVGMTGLPEARLAREAEICYQNVAMVTDFDAWAEDAVDVAEVVRVLGANAANAQALVREVARRTAPREEPCRSGCDRALDTAIITPREHWPDATRTRLASIAPRIFAAG